MFYLVTLPMKIKLIISWENYNYNYNCFGKKGLTNFYFSFYFIGLGIDLKCAPNEMKVTLEIGIDQKVTNNSIITFENTNCTAVKNRTHFTVASTYDACNTRVANTSGDIVFSNRVVVDPNTIKPNAVIERFEHVTHVFAVNCLLRKENILATDSNYSLTGINNSTNQIFLTQEKVIKKLLILCSHH